MLINICHRTLYRYARPVELRPHRIMTCPRGKYDLKLVKTLLSTSPPASIEWTQDVFGNLIATADFPGTADTLVIDSRVVVEQGATNWPAFAVSSAAQTFPFAYSAEETVDLGALLLPASDAQSEMVREWARSFVMGRHPDTLTVIKAINEGVHREIHYRWQDEKGIQSASQTLAMLSGSCRDLATLFVEAMRHLGMGARIVSGYLFDISGDRHGTTHAWAEVYLPSAGWIAFDPTSAHVGGANLIPVAIGRTIEQVLPVSGGHIGAPEDLIQMRTEVSLTAAGASAQHMAY